jgi:hypothetical protein
MFNDLIRHEPKAKEEALPIHVGGLMRCDDAIPPHTALPRLQRKSPGTATGASWEAGSATLATLATVERLFGSLAKFMHGGKP